MEDFDLFKSEKLSRAVESTADAVIITDPGGVIGYINPAFETITGYSSAEAIGQNPRILKSGLNPPELYKSMWDTLLWGNVWRGNVINKRKDGSTYFAELTISPIRVHSGRIINYVGVQRDVTESVRAQEQIRLRTEEYKMLHEVAKALQTAVGMREMLQNVLLAILRFEELKTEQKAGIFLANREGNGLELFAHMGDFGVEFLNKEKNMALEAYFRGCPPVSGEIMTGDHDFFDSRHERQFKDMTAHGHYIVPLKSRDKMVGILFLYTRPKPPGYEHNREILLSIGGLIADAIEQARGEEEIRQKNLELQKLNSLKNELLGMAAHDLRNPLYVIKSYSEALAEEYLGPLNERQSKLVNTIRESSNYMSALLNDLLDIAAIDSGKIVLEKKAADFNALILKRVELHQAVACKKNIEFRANLSPLPVFPFDQNRITQAIDNLLSNAVKFSPRGGGVIVSTQNMEDRVRFSVADEGPGISAADQKLLFSEFQTLGVKQAGEEKSIGLGLAIAKKIVSLHTGEIGVSSVKGKGSTFYFSLPLKPCDLNKSSFLG